MTVSDQHSREKPAGTALSPPDAELQSSSVGRRRNVPLLILAAFIVLLLGTGGVLFLLPDKQLAPLEKPAAQIAQGVVPVAPALKTAADASADTDRAAALAAREETLSSKVKAQAQSIELWAEQRFQVLLQAIDDADQALGESDTIKAAGLYKQASAELKLLLDSRQEIYRNALAAGQENLNKENGSEATKYFKQALAIEPTSEEAQAGLNRAETIEAVAVLHREALSLEQSGELQEALARLKKLLEIDGSYEPARLASERIQVEITGQRFAEEMDAFFSAIGQKDLGLAQKYYESLNKLGINRQQVDQAEKILAEEQELAFITAKRKIVDQLSEAEQWQKALEVYNEILQVAPDALFAVNGKAEAAKRAELDAALADAINRPHRLQDEQQRTAAVHLLTYARQMTPRGPRLADQLTTLDDLIANAAQPVAIILESDNETQVSIYHVGRLGAFVSKQIVLKPGTYTLVGSKNGYRDVRKTITIGADEPRNRFSIRCEEPI